MIVYVLHVYSMYTYMAFFQHVCLYNFEMGNFRKRKQHDPSEFHRFHDVFLGYDWGTIPVTDSGSVSSLIRLISLIIGLEPHILNKVHGDDPLNRKIPW